MNYELIYIIIFSMVINLVVLYRYVLHLLSNDTKDISNEKLGKDIKDFLHFQNIYDVKINEVENGFNASCFKLGGLIYIEISKDMINLLRPNLIKSIIGHEIGHIVKGHSKIKMFVKTLTTSILLITTYKLYQIEGYYLLAFPILFIIKIFIDNYISRIMEYSADKYSAEVNGKDNMIVVLKKLEKLYGDKKGIFSTHPTYINRIKKIT